MSLSLFLSSHSFSVCNRKSPFSLLRLINNEKMQSQSSLGASFSTIPEASFCFPIPKDKSFSTVYLYLPILKPRKLSLSVKSSLFSSTPNSSSMAVAAPNKWAQTTVTLPPLRRGCHLVTSQILDGIGEDLSEFKCGLAHLFLHHTSASLTINENYDSDVRDDTETFLNKIVPEGRSAPWKHTLEGPDDMPAHIKSSMFGCSLTIPITNGKLNMGTWQGIWLCEHRDYPTARKVVVTLNGI